MERLSTTLHSETNRLFWKVREKLKFRRAHYREGESEPLPLPPAAARLAARYGMGSFSQSLNKDTFLKNLATLHTLEQLLPERESPATLLEPGSQDFSRLPALRAYFPRTAITGLEVDPYPVLQGLHSRFDKAEYYRSLVTGTTRYIGGDFFRWPEAAEAVASFYPFVSEHPALAWGLPREFGRPEAWVESFQRCLKPGGWLLVVHQGPWEEEAFDEARQGARLELTRRARVDCPFYELPHPACGSVYRRL